jgi:tetratricopeptide (TPR) repeat protein
MQENNIKINKMLIHQAEIMKNNGNYENALNKLNETINNLIYFCNSCEPKDKREMLYTCFFNAGRCYFEMKKFSNAVENFTTAKSFNISKEDNNKTDKWIDGCIDELEFLIKKNDKNVHNEIIELNNKLHKNKITNTRIDKLIKSKNIYAPLGG